MIYFLNKAIRLAMMLVIFSSTTTLVFGQFTGDSYASAKAKGSAEWVYTYTEAPGFSSMKDGQLTGITIDLMKKFEEYVERTQGIKIKSSIKTTNSRDFSLFLNEVKNSKGGVFGLGNITITEGRKKTYNFSPPYITNIGMILTHNSVSTMNDLSEISKKFAGMTAVTIKNSTDEKRIKEIKAKYFPDMKIVYVSSFGAGMDVILDNPHKFVHADFTYYFDAMKNRYPVKRHPGGDNNTEQFGIIMPKDNDWAPLLAKFMNEEFVGSMDYKKIISDNLGQGATKFFESINSK